MTLHRRITLALVSVIALVWASAPLARVGETRVADAAMAGDAGTVRSLIQQGADVNVPAGDGMTALHWAAEHGDADLTSLLLKAGATPRAETRIGRHTPLHVAATAGNPQVVRLLVAANAEVNARTATGAAPLHFAAASGSADTIAALVDRGADVNAREPQWGQTPLMLEAGADLDQVSASDHTSPLLMATINGHFDLAMQLVARGANVRLASDAGATPLYGVLNMQWAPKARHPQPAKYMQQQVGYLELADALLKAGANPNARLTKSLWYTTYNRDLLGVDRTGATPFWLAAYTLDIPAMKLLLRYGADPSIGTSKVPERYEEGGPDPTGPDRSGLPPDPWNGPAVAPIHAASGVGYGLGFAGNTHRHVPDGWVPAVQILVDTLGPGRHPRGPNGSTPLPHAAAPRDHERLQELLS